MDWQDLEYLLRKTYHQSRAYSSPLVNRENSLNLSCNGLLSKTSSESLKYHRKILQIAHDIYKTTQKENEKIVVSDIIENYGEEMMLMIAKELKYPSVTGSKTVPKPTNQKLMDKFMETLSENFNRKVNLESVQKTVDMADSALAAIHEITKGSSNSCGDSDDLICLTQSICNTLITKSDSNENIYMEIVEDDQKPANPFMTAKQALAKNIGQRALGQSNANAHNNSYNPAMQARKLLGAKRRFVDPKANESGGNSGYREEGRDINTEFSYYNMNKAPAASNNNTNTSNNNNKNQKPISYNNNSSNSTANPEEPVDERLANIDPRLIEMIRNEIMHRVDNITWDSIAGLEHAKNSIKEIVVWPMLRPDIFKGLRGPPKGLLLFGPPGTGKTMIGKCIASQAKATFFSISASSLTSKWVGEGEKMVRALFAVARCSQPSVIFIDEIDSLLTQRTDGEVEASRRIKTEFLVQFDGAGTNSEDRILVIGATNRPQEIDEAARRRLLKRLYIPLPESEARATIIRNLLANQSHCLSDEDIQYICNKTDGYSGSDMDGLCREAAIGPIRSISDILSVSTGDVRPITRQDFEEALTQVRASVSNQDLELYLDWNQKFGSVSKT